MANGELIEKVDEMLEAGDIPPKTVNRLILQLLRELYVKQGDTSKSLEAIKTSTDDHHKQFHFGPAIKKFNFWAIAFVVFFAFHTASTALEVEGVHVWQLLMKLIGL